MPQNTEGMLGYLAAQAAAAEIATPTNATKLFRVKATGVERVVPEAANCQNTVSMSTGTMHVDYSAFPDPGCGRAGGS